MSFRNVLLPYAAVAATLLTTTLVSGGTAHAATPEGHWIGQIDAPGNAIEIVVDLKPGDSDQWIGNIDIPSQGLTDFPLEAVGVEAERVSFGIVGIPGKPVFQGKLDDNGSHLSGRFTQSGNILRFRLNRTGNAEIAAVEPVVPIAADVAKALVGRWEGQLDVSGKHPRLALVLAADPDRGLVATLDSPDEGQIGMPISRLRVDGSTLRAELSFAAAVFEGDINAARTQIAGSWQQSGKSFPLTLVRAGADAAAAFPAADPESVGIPAAALEQLDQRLQALVDRQDIVGGELLVIKNRHTVLRKAYGWKDRGAGVSLDVDAVYCVRSMTKPLVGTAIQMLIDEGRLQMDTPVRDILPAFDGPKTGRITIEELLTHTAGFPFTTMRKSLSEYGDLGDVAAEAATADLLFAPGSGFHYSDASADTLGAVVAAISGMPLEQFIQQRILDPLAMHDTVTLLADRGDVTGRIPVAYSGGPGSWAKHWEPSDPPLFPLFLGSQSLYATTTDYAKFLALWMDGGNHNGKRLLSADAVTRALVPRNDIGADQDPSDNITNYYGQQWLVRAKTDQQGNRHRVMFGHDGSDGTHAWAWPEQDLMVLYFTQSRGTRSGIEIEHCVESLLVEQNPNDSSTQTVAMSAEQLNQLAGLYWDEDVEHAYYVVSTRGDGLVLDRPGGMHLLFKPAGADGRFVAEANPKVWIAFDRADDGSVSAMRTFFGKRVEHDARHVPVNGLPSATELIARVRKAHGIDRLPDIGAVQLSGSVQFVDRQMEGSVSTTFDSHRNRTELVIGEAQQISMADGDRAWSSSSVGGLDELDGRLRQQVLLDRLPVLLGNWTETFQKIEVLKRIEVNGQSMILVRLVPAIGSGISMYIDEDSGRLVRTDALMQVPGVGIVGVQTMFDDYRDVAGMQIPFHTRSKFQQATIGLVEVQYEAAETRIPTTPQTFRPKSAAVGGE